jgi:hypothetical protein
MRTTQHKSNNSILVPPKGYSIDEVHSCPVTKCLYADGIRTIKTYWVPSKEELEKLNKGDPVVLEVWCNETQPPVSITVGDWNEY